MDHSPHPPSHALSFGAVADTYDRSRPGYPREAVEWLVGRRASSVVELGAGTGKLTDVLLDLGHDVLATDPLEEMLAHLLLRRPDTRVATAPAEQIPAATRSVDTVVAAQAFHWFDAERFLRETARVLRPGGHLAVLWNSRDERIPWVRRLGRIIGNTPQPDDPTAAIDETGMYTTVERHVYRFWQPMTQSSLRDLVVSRSNVATMSAAERERVLRKVDELYDEYGRGHDGMLLPYVTTLCRSTVLPWALAEPVPASEEAGSLHAGDARTPDDPDDDALLIDFR